ncbi:hypothetical protein C7M52_00970 [Mixta theicola]|nr:DUF488 family protein [Mixta theicola]QHM75025.1 hypothetical protein C7M52_00970 [Mixta theicola]
MIQCKRVYQPAAADDGYRVLVDYLWPRGIKKSALPLDEWARGVAPAPALRKAFHQQAIDYSGFSERYRSQLLATPASWQPLLDKARVGNLTLLFSARDEQHNQACVLAEFLHQQLDAG